MGIGMGSVGAAFPQAYNASWNTGGLSGLRAKQREQQGEAGVDAALEAQQQAQDALSGAKEKANAPKGDCQTCKSRKYQDGSDDPGVSFKTPQSVDPKAAASAVAGHEQEHVFREQVKARAEGRVILYQNVTLHSAICPECGRTYVSGGTTRTVSRGADAAQRFQVGLPAEEDGKRLQVKI